MKDITVFTEDRAGRYEKDYQEFLAGRAEPRLIFKDIYGTKTVIDWRKMTVLDRFQNGEKKLTKLYRGLNN